MLKISDKDNKYGISMDCRWATDDEIKRSACKTKVGCINPNKASGIPLVATKTEMYNDVSDSHTLVISNSGSKKTRCVALPTIYALADSGVGESMIITDPKGELYEKSSGYLRNRGYEIQLIDFRDIGSGDVWNPLSEIYEMYKKNKDEGVQMIADFVSGLVDDELGGHNKFDPFWDQMSSSLAVSLILLMFETAKPEEINIKSLISLCTAYGEGGEDLENNKLYKISKSLNPESLAYLQFAGVFNIAEKTRMSVQATLYGMLSLFVNNEKLTNQMSQKDEIDVVASRYKKYALYIIMPDEKATFNKLVSILIHECYVELVDADYEMRKKGKVPVRMNFILDEFATIPQVTDMNSKIAASRSRDIRFILCCQGINQLKSRYGNDANTIIGNCNNLIYMNSKEMELLEYLQKLCGDVVYTIGEKRYVEPLITTNALQHLNKTDESVEALMLVGRNYPYISKMLDIDEYGYTKYMPEIVRKRVFTTAKMLTPEKILARYTELQLRGLFT